VQPHITGQKAILKTIGLSMARITPQMIMAGQHGSWQKHMLLIATFTMDGGMYEN
jgi:hypothetical protein